MLQLALAGFALQVLLPILQPVLVEAPLQEMLVVALLRVGVCPLLVLGVVLALVVVAAAAPLLPAQRPLLQARVPVVVVPGSILLVCAPKQGQVTWDEIFYNKQVEQLCEEVLLPSLAAIHLLLVAVLP
jgi:hypothetical protein